MSTERFKLIHYYYDIDEWEMYDRKADPLEMRNVYCDPSYAPVPKTDANEKDSYFERVINWITSWTTVSICSSRGCTVQALLT